MLADVIAVPIILFALAYAVAIPVSMLWVCIETIVEARANVKFMADET